MPSVRYMVSDVPRSVAFYVDELGFTLDERFGEAFARVSRDGLAVWLSGPASSAARPMPDGRKPEPGGWNRLVLEVDDIATTVERLRERGAVLRNDVVAGPGGKQILVDDPDGNPIELFQARGA